MRINQENLLIDRFINIFKKSPEVNLNINGNNSTNGEDENKTDEVKSESGEISEEDNENLEDDSENKEETISSKNTSSKIIISSIVIALIGGSVYLVIRKKYNNKMKIEDENNKK